SNPSSSATPNSSWTWPSDLFAWLRNSPKRSTSADLFAPARGLDGDDVRRRGRRRATLRPIGGVQRGGRGALADDQLRGQGQGMDGTPTRRLAGRREDLAHGQLAEFAKGLANRGQRR